MACPHAARLRHDDRSTMCALALRMAAPRIGYCANTWLATNRKSNGKAASSTAASARLTWFETSTT